MNVKIGYKTLFTTRTIMRSSSTSPPPLQHVYRSVKNAKAFCFDVDSTVITTEGIDELASYKGCLEQVAALTRGAMGGNVPFRDALQSRLSLIKPSRIDVETFLSKHPFILTRGIEQVIQTLHRKSVHVYLVSGGFTQMILPIAKRLEISSERVFANTILFDEKNGEYIGFDKNAPTSRDGGKTDVVKKLRATYKYEEVVMVGDGATDLQAKTPDAATLFIGYGGCVERKIVKEGADYFIKDWNELLNILD
jgi:phosphoserine phosphatase